MASLDLKSAREYWKKHEDKSIYRIVACMETVENWTLDGDSELEAAMTNLGQALEKVSNFNLGKEDLFVKLCAHLKMSRFLRILQELETVGAAGSASRVIVYAQEMLNRKQDKMSALFLKRNVAFERLRLLSRVFSQKNLDLLTKVLTST